MSWHMIWSDYCSLKPSTCYWLELSYQSIISIIIIINPKWQNVQIRTVFPNQSLVIFAVKYCCHCKIFIEEMEYILTEEDISYCSKAIEDLDDDGNRIISVFDLETVLQRLDLHFEEFQLCKLISQLDSSNQGMVYFEQILQIYQKKRQSEVYGDNDEATLDAYTAIGGPSDKSGHIDGQVLVRIIKEEFDLPIDIEELIRSVDDSGNGEIEYEQFEKMLKDKANFRIK